MRERSGPALREPIRPEETLADAVFRNVETAASTVSFRRRVDGAWIDVTAQEFADQVLAVAKGLAAAGIQPGDRIALLSRTRYEWTVVDYAIWTAGAITVPVYETSSAEQVAWALTDSGASAVVVETATHRETVGSVADQLRELRHVWQLEAPPTGGTTAIDELTALGAEVDDDEVHRRRRAVGADDLATLIYTSGTTGRPKGCELTHRNLIAAARAGLTAFHTLLHPGRSVLLFLPLAHVFARLIQNAAVEGRVTLGHTPNVQDLLGDLASFQPHFVLAVPRVFERVYNGAKQKAHAEGKGKIFDAAETTAIAWSRAQDQGGPGMLLAAKHALFDKLVYGKLRAALGGRCLGTVSGGAPLGERLGHFFRGVGIPVLEGYGLTETAAISTANTLDETKIGTVGRPLSGARMRISEDGEVLQAGDTVFRGYWRNDEATSADLQDGWLHTGDLGELDEEGYLTITGRKKEILVTAGGKNVAPAVLEDRMRAHPLISQAVVVGDQRPFVAALVTIDPEAFPAWRERAGRPGTLEIADVVHDPELRAEIQAAVDDANSAVSQAESIRKFTILPADFTEATGELTPTLKLKRPVVLKAFAQQIDDLYR